MQWTPQAQQLFDTLGVGPGNSLLGGLAVLFIPIPFLFHRVSLTYSHDLLYAAYVGLVR